MQRRSLMLFGALSPAALFMSRYMRARTPGAIAADYREQAQRLNVFASDIQVPADARRLVDFLADTFSNELPPAWTLGSLLERIAQAEFAAVTNSQKLVPEARLSYAWNTYVRTINAPDESLVSPAEVHNLRDAFSTLSRLAWDGGSRNIWSVPSIYATQPNGKMASGCRAVESIRVLWDLGNMPDNLKAARDRVRHGLLVSDQFNERQTEPIASGGGVLEARVFNNPLEDAARQYVKDKGVAAYSKVVVDMLNLTFA